MKKLFIYYGIAYALYAIAFLLICIIGAAVYGLHAKTPPWVDILGVIMISGIMVGIILAVIAWFKDIVKWINIRLNV